MSRVFSRVMLVNNVTRLGAAAECLVITCYKLPRTRECSSITFTSLSLLLCCSSDCCWRLEWTGGSLMAQFLFLVPSNLSISITIHRNSGFGCGVLKASHLICRYYTAGWWLNITWIDINRYIYTTDVIVMNMIYCICCFTSIGANFDMKIFIWLSVLWDKGGLVS